ncbi:MAG: hypothetical protein M9954_01675 [Cyclobacteriaceae bacterium]|nr:hypothetical protein [Cyclobacteriaceae bacterium]
MKTEGRHRGKNKHTTFTDGMRRQIVEQLTIEKWSPELISQIGRQHDRVLSAMKPSTNGYGT